MSIVVESAHLQGLKMDKETLKATHFAGDGSVIKVYENVVSYTTFMNSITLLFDNDETRRLRKRNEKAKGSLLPTIPLDKYTPVIIHGNVVIERE